MGESQCGEGSISLSEGQEHRDSRSATVLLADDDDDMRESLRLWLVNDGQWEVREASNGREALNQLDETIDILVLDRKMPELAGSEVTERLGQTAFDGAVLVVSAYKQDDYLSEDDVAGYMTKPISKEEFINTLQQAAK